MRRRRRPKRRIFNTLFFFCCFRFRKRIYRSGISKDVDHTTAGSLPDEYTKHVRQHCQLAVHVVKRTGACAQNYLLYIIYIYDICIICVDKFKSLFSQKVSCRVGEVDFFLTAIEIWPTFFLFFKKKSIFTEDVITHGIVSNCVRVVRIVKCALKKKNHSSFSSPFFPGTARLWSALYNIYIYILVFA